MTNLQQLGQSARFTALLACSQLWREKRRLFVALAGIAFAAVLMLMQLGFRDSLYESTTVLHRQLRGDLVVISSQYEFIGSTDHFTRRQLYQAFCDPDVQSVTPLYVSMARWKNPENHRLRSIMVLGFEPGLPALQAPGLAQVLPQIRMPDTVLFDEASRPEFGSIRKMFQDRKPVVAEVERQRVHVGGLFKLGTSFAADGNLVVSESGFLRLFPNRRPGVIDIGLITLRPHANLDQKCRLLSAILPNDVIVLTRQQFIELERKYWAEATPIGFIFAIGLLMGFIVGLVIVYQILYTDVTDHLAEYATLKAIGHGDQTLFLVVAQQAIILSVLGFIPAWLITSVLFAFTEQATMVPMPMTLGHTITVFLATLAMCGISGLLAMRRLSHADPAEVF